MKDLKELLLSKWEDAKEHRSIYPGVKLEQVSWWCLLEKDDHYEIIDVKFMKDSLSLKDRVIDHAIQTGDSSFPVPMKALGLLDNDEMEERWSFVEDFELVDGSGEMPIIKRI